jgi:hypothetical protein
MFREVWRSEKSAVPLPALHLVLLPSQQATGRGRIQECGGSVIRHVRKVGQCLNFQLIYRG